MELQVSTNHLATFVYLCLLFSKRGGQGIFRVLVWVCRRPNRGLKTSWCGSADVLVWVCKRPGLVFEERRLEDDLRTTYGDVFASSWSRPQDVQIVVFRTSYRGVGGLHFATDIRF